MMYPYSLHILIFNIFDILKKGISFLSYFDLFFGPIEDDLGTKFESTTCIVFLSYRLTIFVLLFCFIVSSMKQRQNYVFRTNFMCLL